MNTCLHASNYLLGRFILELLRVLSQQAARGELLRWPALAALVNYRKNVKGFLWNWDNWGFLLLSEL